MTGAGVLVDRAAWRPHGFGGHTGFGFHPGFGGHYGFGGHGFGGHGFGGGAWIAHVVVSSIIHGLIYGAIFRILAHLGLGEILLLAVVVIGGIYLWNRNRGIQRW